MSVVGPQEPASQLGWLAAGLVILAALIAWPFSGTPLGDDFSYAKTALEFARTGHLVYTGWASMLLGWQAVWGALWIRVFGFSFNILRISTMVVGSGCIYLFHQILLRFGVHRQNAFLGALILGLNPLFLPLMSSFMSDIPGLFSVLLCMALCQRAVAASAGRHTNYWLMAAIASNLLTGTVRQICWLGALVMVPATAWFLRRRRGALMTGAIGWTVSMVCVFVCMHWFNQQPGVMPERIWPGPIRLSHFRTFGSQWFKSSLFLVLITLPASLGWVLAMWQKGSKSRFLVIGCFGVMALLWWALWSRNSAEPWLMPWLVPVLANLGMLETHGPLLVPVTLSLRIRTVLSVLAAGCGLLVGLQTLLSRRGVPKKPSSSLGAAFWIMGPFSASVVLMMSPRAIMLIIQDRYLLLLMPTALLLLLRGYQAEIGPRLPSASIWALLLFALYGIGGTYDQQATARAEGRALAKLEAAGISRSRISQGFGPDEWVEVQRLGHVNMPSSSWAFQVQVPRWHALEGCDTFHYILVPAIHAEYFLTSAPGRCDVDSGFAPVPYHAWLPPFRRSIYIVKSSTPNLQ